MESVDLLLALPRNITVLMQNVILQMTCETFQARRRHFAGVLLQSENRSHKSRTSIYKRRNKENTG